MASGDILWVCEPLAGQAPDTAPMGLAWLAVADTHQIPCLTADPGATDEKMDWKCYMPAHYDGGGVTVEIIWGADQTASTNNVIWDAQFKRIPDDAESILTAAYAAVQSVTALEPTVTDEVAHDTIAFTSGSQMDSVVAGEMFFFRLSRDADNASDTMTGADARVFQVIIKET